MVVEENESEKQFFKWKTVWRSAFL